MIKKSRKLSKKIFKKKLKFEKNLEIVRRKFKKYEIDSLWFLCLINQLVPKKQSKKLREKPIKMMIFINYKIIYDQNGFFFKPKLTINIWKQNILKSSISLYTTNIIDNLDNAYYLAAHAISNLILVNSWEYLV